MSVISCRGNLDPFDPLEFINALFASVQSSIQVNSVFVPCAPLDRADDDRIETNR